MRVLGVDIGTSSVRAFLFDAECRRLGGAQLAYRWSAMPGGGVEVEAEQIVQATATAIDGALGAAGGSTAGGIAAIGVAALWHTLVGVGANGVALTPVYSWSDQRARSAAAALRARLDERAVHARTGAMLHPSYLPARLLWLRETDAALFRQVRYWMSAAEYVEWRLFGERRVSLSMASATGLFEQGTGDWDAPILDAVSVRREQLSPLVDLDAAISGLRAEFGDRWPALRAVPWLPAVGDGAAANVGSGCTTPERVALSVGTSGALRVLFEANQVDIPLGLWCYRLDRQRYLLGGAISNGGSLYRWLGETLRLPPLAEVERALATLPPDGHGLTVLPFLAGERSPDWPLDGRATIAGISAQTTPIQVLQAFLEAATYRLALIRRRLLDYFPRSQTIVASGSALRHSRAWLQLVADVFGEPVWLARDEEASSRGAALLALAHSGIPGHVGGAPIESYPPAEPDRARHARYAVGLERHLRLAEAMGPAFGDAASGDTVG